MHVIGEDSSQRLDRIPAQYQVIVTHRPKYGCRACESAVVQAPAPERLIKNGIPTERLVASVVVDKYAWHNPLYRQAQIMRLQGLPVDRSTLAFWVGVAAAEVKPVYQRLKEILLGSAKIAVDETRAPVLDPGRGRTKTGYFWAISRDDRPWGGSDPPGVAYTYAPGRGGEHAIALLAGYSGIIQCDGYAVYEQLADPARHDGTVTLLSVGCTGGASSSISTRVASRRSPTRPWNASRRSMPSRAGSAVAARRSAVPSARPRRSHWWRSSRPGSRTGCSRSRRRAPLPKRSAMG
jgi:transposase